jgi:hypothetical protein
MSDKIEIHWPGLAALAGLTLITAGLLRLISELLP